MSDLIAASQVASTYSLPFHKRHLIASYDSKVGHLNKYLNPGDDNLKKFHPLRVFARGMMNFRIDRYVTQEMSVGGVWTLLLKQFRLF